MAPILLCAASPSWLEQVANMGVREAIYDDRVRKPACLHPCDTNGAWLIREVVIVRNDDISATTLTE